MLILAEMDDFQLIFPFLAQMQENPPNHNLNNEIHANTMVISSACNEDGSLDSTYNQNLEWELGFLPIVAIEICRRSSWQNKRGRKMKKKLKRPNFSSNHTCKLHIWWLEKKSKITKKSFALPKRVESVQTIYPWPKV